MSAMFRITRPISSLMTQTSIKPALTLTIRSFSGGNNADMHHPHLGAPCPGYDTTQNTDDNPWLWDPHYSPQDESDWDRRIMEPYMENRYAIEPDQPLMSKDDCLRRIAKICGNMDRAQTEGKVVTANTHIYNDLGLDSLDQVEFGLALEEEFDIEIPDEEAEQIVTIGDAIELICDHPKAV